LNSFSEFHFAKIIFANIADTMKILVRLPNWLGDMVMAVGFIDQLKHFFPGAEVSVIAKKGIHELLSNFPEFRHVFIFEKSEYKGWRGLWKFGRAIRKVEKFDLFFSLPDSHSSAMIGFASGSRKRVGFAKEMRSVLLTNSYRKPTGLHRVEEYITLLEEYTGKKAAHIKVSLINNFTRNGQVIVNINSEASSRRLTVVKAIELVHALHAVIKNEIVLIGAPKEKIFIDQVYKGIMPGSRVVNRAGDTNLAALIELIGSAQLVLSTDSGPAHLSNALGTHTIVLFGAGNEQNTSPYNKQNLGIIRLGKLSCEPCEKNTCFRYGIPQCLEQLNSHAIVQEIKQHLSHE
jgi:heptosyltransferase II